MGQEKRLKKIPESEMEALWNCNDDNLITEFIILSSGKVSKKTYAKYDSSDGKGSKNWGNGDFQTSARGLFVYLASQYGFQSRKIAYNVLKQFSKVENQKWAKLTRDLMDDRLL